MNRGSLPPVGSQFGQMVSNIQLGIAFTIGTNPFTEKWPRGREAGIKDELEEMEHEFSFGTFRPETQGIFEILGGSNVILFTSH